MHIQYVRACSGRDEDQIETEIQGQLESDIHMQIGTSIHLPYNSISLGIGRTRVISD